MRSTSVTLLALCTALAGCNTVRVSEGVLSSNQRVAMVSNPGDGVTPPTTSVFIEDRPGHFVPVSTVYGQAVVPAMMGGLAGGAAIGVGNIVAARLIRPSRTVVNAEATGGAGGQGGSGPVNSFNDNNNNNNNVVGDGNGSGNIGDGNLIGDGNVVGDGNTSGAP